MQRVLLIDDMPGFREPVAAILRRNGFEVVCASTGKDATAALAATPPDIILLDVAMPDVDGITFLRELRADPRWARLPVLVLTAMMERDLVRLLSDVRVEDHMIKSQFSLKQLIVTIRKHLPARTAAA